MVLQIITPLTREENLPAIRESIEMARGKGVQIFWTIFVDPAYIRPGGVKDCPEVAEEMIFPLISGVAGHVHRNTSLMQIELDMRLQSPRLGSTWIMSLDDDNILHPHLIPWMVANKDVLEYKSGVIFDQVMKDGSTRLTADPDKITVGNVDTAQYMFRASIVQGLRFDETRYDADGVFIEELYLRHKEKFLIVNQPLCYYNYLRS